MARSTGIARRRSTIPPFVMLIVEMLESPPWRVLSLSARRVLDRIAIELRHHGGHDGDRLCVTFADFQKYGIERHAIAPAIREAEALGFLRITVRGRAGNADFRRPQRYQLTYVKTVDDEPTHGWRRFNNLSLAEVKQRAVEARKSVPKNKKPVRDSRTEVGGVSRTENRNFSVRVSPPLGDGENPTTVYISGRVVGRQAGGRTSPRQPPTGVKPAKATTRHEARTGSSGRRPRKTTSRCFQDR